MYGLDGIAGPAVKEALVGDPANIIIDAGEAIHNEIARRAGQVGDAIANRKGTDVVGAAKSLFGLHKPGIMLMEKITGEPYEKTFHKGLTRGGTADVVVPPMNF